MRVELDHGLLLTARREVRRLADAVRSSSHSATSASPIDLPSLAGLAPKAEWLDSQRSMLAELGALALLLDRDGDGTTVVTVPDGAWDPSALLREAADQQLGPGFVEATGLEGEELSSLLLTLGSVGRSFPPGLR